MDKVRAPYNFVPLDPQVVEADVPAPTGGPDGALDLHDRPFQDGICGTLAYEVTAHTPVFVRGSNDTKAFFALPDGALALPGTSVRGMLRNVLEIASFSRMSRFNDHAYSIRDLTPAAAQIYGRQMSEIAKTRDGRSNIFPVVSAAWLRKGLPEDADPRWRDPAKEGTDEEVVAHLEVCDFVKFEYAGLERLATERGVERFNPGQRQSAVQKYNAWQRAGASLDVTFTHKNWRPRGGRSDELKVPLLSAYGLLEQVVAAPTASAVHGHVVFTGQPNVWDARQRNVHRGGNAKHHDFVFYRGPGEGRPKVFPVTRAALRRFAQVHADRGQQARLEDAPNVEWSFWKRVFDGAASVAGHPRHSVPVFVLPQETDGEVSVRAFGLAMMFRLAYDHPIERAVTNAQRRARDVDVIDLASALFGRVENRKTGTADRTLALRGRVSVGVARAQGRVTVMPEVRCVLGAPRASYYPNYFEHGDAPSAQVQSRAGYTTLMDGDVRVRGWKRYLPRAQAVAAPPLPQRRMGERPGHEERNDDVQTVFRPAPAGTRFAGTIRIHNLRPWELGALLWALDFGGAKDAFHTLGLAKSFGYGRVTARVTAHALERNDGAAVDLAACVMAFADSMDRALGGKGRWQGSEVMRQLLACVKLASRPEDLRHMELRHPDHRNEFVEAKKAGMALAPAAPFDAKAWAARKEQARKGAFERVAAPAASKAAPAEDVVAREEAEFRKAYQGGAYEPLLRRWMQEGGALAPMRRAAAMRVLVTISSRMRKRQPELMAWLETKG